MFIITLFPGSSAGASALGSGPRGRRFKSSLPDRGPSLQGPFSFFRGIIFDGGYYEKYSYRSAGTEKFQNV